MVRTGEMVNGFERQRRTGQNELNDRMEETKLAIGEDQNDSTSGGSSRFLSTQDSLGRPVVWTQVTRWVTGASILTGLGAVAGALRAIDQAPNAG